MCFLWEVRLQACPFVQPGLLTKLIITITITTSKYSKYAEIPIPGYKGSMSVHKLTWKISMPQHRGIEMVPFLLL